MTDDQTLSSDEVAIMRLVYRYAELCDHGYEPDGLAALFTEDATWSSASADGSLDYGRPQGREEIRALFASVSDDIGETVHSVADPQIKLGPGPDEATGRWNTTVYMKAPGSTALDSGTMLIAVYDHAYRRVDGRWLFARIASRIVFQLPIGAANDAADG